MTDFRRKSQIYKLFFALLAAFLLTGGINNFYRLSSATTDQNVFIDSPSNIYVTKPFAAQELTEDASALIGPDSVKVSDLILSMNDQTIHEDFNFSEYLQSITDSSSLKLELLRLYENQTRTYQLNKLALPDSFYRVLPTTVYVLNVENDGASDIAGMKKGDLIYQINGETFKDALDADKILRRTESGTTILYDIIRNNQNISLAVTLGSFGIRISLLVLFLSGVIFWGVGTFITLNRPENIGARLLGLSFMFFGFMMMVVLWGGGFTFNPYEIIFVHIYYASIPLGLAFWMHSSFYFPMERQELLEKRWVLILPYGLAFLLTALFSFRFFGFFLAIEFEMLLLLAPVVMGACLFTIHFIYRKQKSVEYAKIRKVITITSWLTIVISAVLGVILGLTGQQTQIGFIAIPLVAIPFTCLYIIGRYQLLGMNIRVRRDIQYAIVSYTWITILVILFLRILFFLPNIYIDIPNLRFTGTSIVILDVPPDPRAHDFVEKLVLITLALGLAFVFLKLARRGQELITHKFNRDKFDISRATNELAEVMATKVGLEELANGIAERLAKVMQLKRVGVLFFREHETCCQEAFGFDRKQWEKFCLNSGALLVTEMQKFKSESRFSTEYLQADLKSEFIKHGFRHIVPIRFKTKLVGTFIIGEKLSESPLHLDDLTFLAAVAKQASISIENAFLYEELTEQERLKHELEIARRIQLASLPQKTPQIAGLDIAGTSIPALEVGGDYYDYLNGVSKSITVIVGDVSGKGTSAALYMSKIQGILRSLHEFNLSPKELFVRANQLLCRDMEKKSFVTAIGAFIDNTSKKLILARAGHLPLFYYHAPTKEVRLITPKGLGLGLDEAEVFATELEEEVIKYQPGDIFLFVTDGITEAQTYNGGEFGEEKLSEILAKSCSNDANGIRDLVLSEVKLFVNDQLPHDDQTVVVVKAL